MTPRHRPWESSAEFAIGLRPIAPEDWLEGGEDDPASRKDDLLARNPHQVWAELSGSRPAQLEARDLVDATLGPSVDPSDLPPLYAAARRIPDDLCLMEAREGDWRLTALSLSAGTFFTAGEVIGHSLADLHGPVNGFSDRLLPRVRRIFDGLRPDLILERRNWTVVNSAALFTPSSADIRGAIADIDPTEAAQLLNIRVERQTLRRLPQTGAALFSIRVWLTPLEALCAEPERLTDFAKAWRAASPEFRTYKRFDLYDALVEGVFARSGL